MVEFGHPAWMWLVSVISCGTMRLCSLREIMDHWLLWGYQMFRELYARPDTYLCLCHAIIHSFTSSYLCLCTLSCCWRCSMCIIPVGFSSFRHFNTGSSYCTVRPKIWRMAEVALGFVVWLLHRIREAPWSLLIEEAVENLTMTLDKFPNSCRVGVAFIS